MLRTCGIVLLVCVGVAAAPPEPTVRSAGLAKQLGAALLERKLEAIAARDPEKADRFVAALFFPDSQLLVISASYSSPSLLDEKLAQKNYRDVYLDLGTSQFANTSVFFQDMKADGLCDRRDQTADILSRGGRLDDIRRRLEEARPLGTGIRAETCRCRPALQQAPGTAIDAASRDVVDA